MIKLTQEKDADGERVIIDKALVLQAYSVATAEVPSMPMLPQNGFGAQSARGPWFLYNDLYLCQMFATVHECIVVKKGEAKIPLKVEAIDLTKSELKNGKMSSEMVKTLTVHVALRVPNGVLFRRINMAMLKEAWNTYDFIVLKANRAGVKFEGKRIRDKGTVSEEFHFDIRPRDGNIWGARFPEQVVLNIMGTRQYLEYKIFEHPDLTGAMCLSRCHRYFPNVVQANGWKVEACPGHAFSGGKGGPSGNSGMAAFMEAVNASRQEKAGTECKWYALGKCHYARSFGRKCDFQHTMPSPDPGLIACQHPK